MRLAQIYKDTVNQWPRYVITDDCLLSSDRKRLSCKKLDDLYWSMEKQSIHGEWGQLMCWGIVCGIKKYIRSLQYPYPDKILINKLDLEYAIEKINESINEPGGGYYDEIHLHDNDLHTLLEKN